MDVALAGLPARCKSHAVAAAAAPLHYAGLLSADPSRAAEPLCCLALHLPWYCHAPLLQWRLASQQAALPPAQGLPQREHRAPAVARGQLPTHLPLLCEHARQSQDLSQHRCCQACENITEQVRGQDEADGLSIETPQKPTRLLN